VSPIKYNNFNNKSEFLAGRRGARCAGKTGDLIRRQELHRAGAIVAVDQSTRFLRSLSPIPIPSSRIRACVHVRDDRIGMKERYEEKERERERERCLGLNVKNERCELWTRAEVVHRFSLSLSPFPLLRAAPSSSLRITSLFPRDRLICGCAVNRLTAALDRAVSN